MTDPSSDVRIPARSLAVLADRCVGLGEAGISALREGGRAAGEDLADRIADTADPASTGTDAFWGQVDRQLHRLDLGSLTYRVRTPSVAEVRMEGHPEADREGADGGGCPFATGLLGGILADAAGAPVSVLEVECRSDGAEACRFLVGAEARLSDVRARLASGASLREAVAEP